MKCLKFKLFFPELLKECKPAVSSVIAACKEVENDCTNVIQDNVPFWFQVKQSKKFAKTLELILLMGNILNTGSRYEQSVGFDISYLPKLSNTKDKDNKHTLLHFLVKEIKENHPSNLDFQV